MTDYILTAYRFDQIVERHPDGRAKRYVKHRRGAVISDLTEVEVERLTVAGAIRPVALPAEIADEEPDADPDDDSGSDDGTDEEPDTDTSGVDEDVEPAPEPAAPAPVGRPLKTAAVAEWREFAMSKGLTEDEAAKLSRAELISRYGSN